MGGRSETGGLCRTGPASQVREGFFYAFLNPKQRMQFHPEPHKFIYNEMRSH